MKRNTQISCIIPFYNEELRPVKVVESILKVKGISKIIVVDDGSSEEKAYFEIKQRFPQIFSIRLNINGGKANAIKEGLKHVNTEYVFLIDGDLSNIKSDEVEKAIENMIKSPSIDMIILPLVADIIGSNWFRWYTILSGQRILRKQDLEKIYGNHFSGFQIEAAINDYMIKSKKKTYWMSSSMHNFDKYSKWGKWEGIKRVFSLIKDFSDYTGWSNLIWQTLFFCRKKAI